MKLSYSYIKKDTSLEHFNQCTAGAAKIVSVDDLIISDIPTANLDTITGSFKNFTIKKTSQQSSFTTEGTNFLVSSTTSTPPNSTIFFPTGGLKGIYEIGVLYIPGNLRSTAVKHTVTHVNGITDVNLDQTNQGIAIDKYNLLSDENGPLEFTFNGDPSEGVTISSGNRLNMCINAIKFTCIDTPAQSYDVSELAPVTAPAAAPVTTPATTTPAAAPVITTTKPIVTTTKPIVTTTKPIVTTTKPIVTTTKPITTTTKPIVTTAKPITTTAPAPAPEPEPEPVPELVVAPEEPQEEPGQTQQESPEQVPNNNATTTPIDDLNFNYVSYQPNITHIKLNEVQVDADALKKIDPNIIIAVDKVVADIAPYIKREIKQDGNKLYVTIKNNPLSQENFDYKSKEYFVDNITEVIFIFENPTTGSIDRLLKYDLTKFGKEPEKPKSKILIYIIILLILLIIAYILYIKLKNKY
jgi:hypothetical protein